MRRVTALTTSALLVVPLAATAPLPAAHAGPVAHSAPAATGTAVLAATGAAVLTPAGTATSARAAAATARANARIVAKLPARTKSKVLGKRFTMTVWDTSTSRYVYSKRGNASLRGASTTKILTSVGVLKQLGPAHRLPTTVRAGAKPGELVLVAGGDPLLTSANLRALASSTAAALRGSTAPTASPAPTPSPSAATTTSPTPTPSSNVAAAAYSGPVSVYADDSLFPGSGFAHGWRASYVPSEVRSVGAFARDDRKVRDATADAGAYFVARLRTLGIDAKYRGERTAPTGSATVARFAGHTVGQAVSHALLVSDNDTAEMLFRLIAVGRGKRADWAGARAAQAQVLRSLSIPLSGVRIVDGSGLSLDGRVTAKALTSALNRALDPKHPELAGLRGWLPVAGRTGTLKASYKRFTSKPAKCAAGRIQAKTGTVADSIALAGYAAGSDGRTKIFVSIVNQRPTRYTRAQTRTAVDRTASTVTGCW